MAHPLSILNLNLSLKELWILLFHCTVTMHIYSCEMGRNEAVGAGIIRALCSVQGNVV